MTEAEMFKSHLGVIATMREVTPQGKPAVEVFAVGAPQPLTEADIKDWAAEYRKVHGYPQPTNLHDYAREQERAMARAADPIEEYQKRAKAQEKAELVQLVAQTVIAALKSEIAAPAPAAPPAAERAGRARGRNDEKPEAG
jgi:hypothetical protein